MDISYSGPTENPRLDRPARFLHVQVLTQDEPLPPSVRPMVLGGKSGLFAPPSGRDYAGETYFANHARFFWTDHAVKYVATLHNFGPGTEQLLGALLAGSIDCWGRNAAGQLGNGSTASSNVPVAVSGITNATQISASTFNSCALLADGQIDCWGNTGGGVPFAVSGIAHATQVSAGRDHSCALLMGGQIACWGNNDVGQLGNGSTANSPVPVAVSGITNATQISAGSNYSCALLAGGQIDCWGGNGGGQLGNGSTATSPVPVAVSGITNATQISAGADDSCALLADTGHIACWGDNSYGELGNGSTVNSSLPVAVSGIP